MDINELTADQGISLVTEIETVLNARHHKRLHLGEEIIVPGSLSKALKLPELKNRLIRYRNTNFEPYQSQLNGIWSSLSDETKTQVLEKLGLYDPKDYDWDDPKSNRKPIIKD